MTHGHKTRYPSLVLGNEGGLGGEGRSNTLSYNQFGRGIPSSNNLRGLYDAMFNADPDLQKKPAFDDWPKIQRRSLDRVLAFLPRDETQARTRRFAEAGALPARIAGCGERDRAHGALDGNSQAERCSQMSSGA